MIDRFAGQRSALPPLDVLASSASPKDTLENRLNWLVDVVRWIRRPGHDDAPSSSPEIQIQEGRLRRLLDVLDRNPAWKKSVAQTLRSIIRETSALELFSETGLPRQSGLLAEISERLARKLLPPPGSAELGILFDRLFPHPRDDAWIESLDETTLRRFRDLLEFEIAPEEAGWNVLSDELQDALFHLAAQLNVSGCSAAMRARIKHQRIRELPFFKFSGSLQTLLAAREAGDQETFLAELNHLRGLIESSHRAAEEVLRHLENLGVSTEVVYQLAFIEASLARFETLLELNFNGEQSLARIAAFVAALVRENRAQESVVELMRENFHLLTRKILERNAETGEHYIARTRREYGEMLRSAGGGGVIMAFTTWMKLILLGWHLPALMEGLAASVNYAGGFVAIQLTGSTLATKQPANTAPALAARMHQVREPEAQEALVNEIVYLIRSQFASIVGNLALVAPTMLGLHFVILWLTGEPMMASAKAPRLIHSLSIAGPSLFYAAFTGVLLWASSMVAAWADNWFACHRIGEALATDQRLVRTLGTTRAFRFGRFWKNNVAGLAGNISFGFMLGLIPEIAAFAGLPLDIRHVTLSSSMLVAAAASLGSGVLATWPFWAAVLGIAGIGLMNVGVSFSLAMFVAIRARGIESPERHAIYRALGRRLWREPFSFLFPVGRVCNPPAESSLRAPVSAP
ncbi:MAG TPA: site-specific recombinase [Verrucomicrobiae bacterium]|nr:site-specific recombinase [Verrucomicrobiae bacterium]